MTVTNKRAVVMQLILEAIAKGYALRIEPDGLSAITLHAFHRDHTPVYLGHTHCGVPELDNEMSILKAMEVSIGGLVNTDPKEAEI